MSASRIVPLLLVVAGASLVARLDAVTAAEQPASAAPVTVPTTTAVAAATPRPSTRMAAALDNDLAVRRQQVDTRLREIEMRERLLAAAESRLKQTAATPAAQTAANTARAQAQAGERDTGQRVVALVKLYQAMQPRAAARIFERLDENVQTAVALHMRERSMAAIMAEMNPDAATKLTMALARRPETLRPTAL